VRILRAFLVYLGVVFLGAALVAPWVYLGIQHAAESSSFLSGVASKPFHRYVNRAILVLAILGIWPLLRATGVSSWRAVGFLPVTGQGRVLARGFLLGFFSLAGVALAAGLSGARAVQSDLTLSRFLLTCGGALATAITVSLLEEALFRGLLFGRLRVALGDTSGLLGSSLIFALVHFFQRPPAPSEITPWTGLWTLGQMLHGLVEWRTWMPAFLTLCLAGWILALLYKRSGAIYASIGLHAGWIFWLKAYGAFTVAQPGASPWVWGSSQLLDGWIAWVGMIFCLIWVGRKDSSSL
jgi:uncharacterized protein